MKSPFILIQYLVPQHLLSRLTGLFAACRVGFIKNTLIRFFILRYQVDMTEALYPDAGSYASFNAFFTRPLKSACRPLAQGRDTILSPADGTLSAIGRLDADTLLQAKNHRYSLTELLGGDPEWAGAFGDGAFATIYLAPRDYHRVHMPCSGTLEKMIFVPGRLFSVNAATTAAIPRLFARNERVVCLFRTEFGPMAVILVGAMIVASIETVWAGVISPSKQKLYVQDYSRQPPIDLRGGDELGRFKLGSTVIVLFGADAAAWEEGLAASNRVCMGQALGRGTPLRS